MTDRRYANVWQKMLLEEQEEKERAAANAESQHMLDDYDRMLQGAAVDRQRNAERKLGYDTAALPASGGVTQPPPRLPYDFDLGDPLAGPGADGYLDGDIVVNGHHKTGYPSRTVFSPQDCVTRQVGWQNAKNHKEGYGYRAYCDFTDGTGGIVIAHMQPDTIPPSGTLIGANEPMRRYGNPATGDVTGPHLHRGQYDSSGRLIPPNLPSPFRERGQMLSPYGMRTLRGRTRMHKGEDWIE